MGHRHLAAAIQVTAIWAMVHLHAQDAPVLTGVYQAVPNDTVLPGGLRNSGSPRDVHLQPAAADLKSEDSIQIEGYNAVNLTISPSCNPQRGSAAMIANCIPRVIEARPGFITVSDLALPYARFTQAEAL